MNALPVRRITPTVAGVWIFLALSVHCLFRKGKHVVGCQHRGSKRAAKLAESCQLDLPWDVGMGEHVLSDCRFQERIGFFREQAAHGPSQDNDVRIQHVHEVGAFYSYVGDDFLDFLHAWSIRIVPDCLHDMDQRRGLSRFDGRGDWVVLPVQRPIMADDAVDECGFRCDRVETPLFPAGATGSVGVDDGMTDFPCIGILAYDEFAFRDLAGDDAGADADIDDVVISFACTEA